MILVRKDKSESFLPLIVIENKRDRRKELDGLNQCLMTLSCMVTKIGVLVYGILCNGEHFRIVEYK